MNNLLRVRSKRTFCLSALGRRAKALPLHEGHDFVDCDGGGGPDAGGRRVIHMREALQAGLHPLQSGHSGLAVETGPGADYLARREETRPHKGWFPMAHYTTDHPAFGPTDNPIRRIFARLGSAIVALSEANARVREVDALSALSDEALAWRGIKREDIVRHVFRDVYWM